MKSPMNLQAPLLMATIFYLLPLGAFAELPCRTFLFHGAAVPLHLWSPAPVSASRGEEQELVRKLAKLHRENFSKAYGEWKQNSQEPLQQRVERLRCTYFYVSQDSNKNGVPDWSALAERRISWLLFPNDEDIDGDGVPNLLDPAPFDVRAKGELLPGKLPAHLADDRPLVRSLQEELYRRHGLLAINHTDQHSPRVLRELLFLLDELAPFHLSALPNIKVLYAFAGHDPVHDAGAFHPEMKAVSMGGVLSYGQVDLVGHDLGIITTLLHEWGHAFLLQRISATELVEALQRFAHWSLRQKEPADLYDPEFFTKYPEAAPHDNIVSAYAMTNAHEWFAEAFAATLLRQLMQRGLLGGDMARHLRSTNHSEAFEHWILEKLSK